MHRVRTLLTAATAVIWLATSAAPASAALVPDRTQASGDVAILQLCSDRWSVTRPTGNIISVTWGVDCVYQQDVVQLFVELWRVSNHTRIGSRSKTCRNTRTCSMSYGENAPFLVQAIGNGYSSGPGGVTYNHNTTI